tara:strand:+ start:1663 stop:2262 length:600 start_codon:yes stop_codon:yes gene_type:complete
VSGPNLQIEKWQKRYIADANTPLKSPLESIVEATKTLKPGKALDLACGPGRHAVWLAKLGWDVDAVDGASAALHQLRSFSETSGCHRNVHAICADLEAEPPVFQIPNEHYDLIINCHFLYRPLFKAIQHGLRRGGYFIGVIHLAIGSSPNQHSYLVQPGELTTMIQNWKWEIISSQDNRKCISDTQLADSIVIARRPNR